MKNQSIALVGVLASLLSGCGGTPPTAGPSPTAIVLGEQTAYLGFAVSSCIPSPSQCVRGPGFGTDVSVSQFGNSSKFSVGSTDPSVAIGSLVMTGPRGHGSPAIALAPERAGSATLTIAGANGVTASLPVTVTTISTMTIVLNGLPTASDLTFTVSAPPGMGCTSFQAGYTFEVNVPQGTTTIPLRNFPAMGNGNLPACVFTTVNVVVTDNANHTLAQKTASIPVALGKDNPASISLP